MKTHHTLHRLMVGIVCASLTASLCIVPVIRIAQAATAPVAYEVTVEESAELSLDSETVQFTKSTKSGPQLTNLKLTDPPQEMTKDDSVKLLDKGKALLSFHDALNVRIFHNSEVAIEDATQLISQDVSIDTKAQVVAQIGLRVGTMFGSSLESEAKRRISASISTPNTLIEKNGSQFWVNVGYLSRGEVARSELATIVFVQTGSVSVTVIPPVDSGGGSSLDVKGLATISATHVVQAGQVLVVRGEKVARVDGPLSAASVSGLFEYLYTLTDGALSCASVLPYGKCERQDGGGFSVLDVQAQTQSEGTVCHTQVVFTGQISAVGSGTVTYHWENDKGARLSGDLTLPFTMQMGKDGINTPVTLPAQPLTLSPLKKGSGWLRLVVTNSQPTAPPTAPSPIESSVPTPQPTSPTPSGSGLTLISNAVHYRAAFSKKCPPPPPPTPIVRLSASLGCPARVPVSARIFASRGAIRYAWTINGVRAGGGTSSAGAHTLSLSVPLARLGRATVRLTVVSIVGSRVIAQRTFQLSCR